MAQICIRVEDETKKAAEEACGKIGLSLSSAINIYLKKIGREQRIPFELTADPFYFEENMARLRQSIADVQAGRASLQEHDLIEV